MKFQGFLLYLTFLTIAGLPALKSPASLRKLWQFGLVLNLIFLIETPLLALPRTPTDIPPTDIPPTETPPPANPIPVEGSPPGTAGGNPGVSFTPNVQAAVDRAVADVIDNLYAGNLTVPTGDTIPGDTQQILLAVLIAEPNLFEPAIESANLALIQESGAFEIAAPTLQLDAFALAAATQLLEAIPQDAALNDSGTLILVRGSLELPALTSPLGSRAQNSPNTLTDNIENDLTSTAGGPSVNLAQNLASNLLGLLSCSRLNPPSCQVNPAKLMAAVAAYNAVINASSEAFLKNPPTTLLAIRAILSDLVNAAIAAESQRDK